MTASKLLNRPALTKNTLPLPPSSAGVPKTLIVPFNLPAAINSLMAIPADTLAVPNKWCPQAWPAFFPTIGSLSADAD